jgi:hypothetical protein
MPIATAECGCGAPVAAPPVATQTYRLDYQTVYDERQVTAERVSYETVYDTKTYTVQKPVWETQTRERRYTVQKPVWETQTREERYTVMKPVTETVIEDRSYDVTRDIVETASREELGTVVVSGDGIAKVEGLPSAMANELLEFSNGTRGIALNLDIHQRSDGELRQRLGRSALELLGVLPPSLPLPLPAGAGR